jgi:hypothetical protein
MTWPRRLLAVPTSALRVDGLVGMQSPKGYSEQELQEIAATVPAIYDRMAGGWSPEDFEAARWSQNQRDRVLGETYAFLFRDTSSSDALSASYDGEELVVDRGNHRVRAGTKHRCPGAADRILQTVKFGRKLER